MSEKPVYKWDCGEHGLDPEFVARMIREHIKRPEPPLVRAGPLGGLRINHSRFLREAFPIEKMPTGALAIYDHDPDLDLTDLVAGTDDDE